jgi:predicted N-acetyltransferase YhbS
MMPEVEIREGLEGLSAGQIETLYRRAPLLRPYQTSDELWKAYRESSLVLSAWYQGRLAGIVRVLSDRTLYTFLCDLAVEPDVQRMGVGKALIDEVARRCAGTEILLKDSSGSSSYYPKIGFNQVSNTWVRRA